MGKKIHPRIAVMMIAHAWQRLLAEPQSDAGYYLRVGLEAEKISGEWGRPEKATDWVDQDDVLAFIAECALSKAARNLGGAPSREDWEKIYLRHFLPEFDKQGGKPGKGKPKHWRSGTAAAEWLGSKIVESGGHPYETDHLRKIIRQKLLPWAKQGITSFAQ